MSKKGVLIRFDEAEVALLDRAAAVERRPRAALIRYAALEHARKAIRDEVTTAGGRGSMSQAVALTRGRADALVDALRSLTQIDVARARRGAVPPTVLAAAPDEDNGQEAAEMIARLYCALLQTEGSKLKGPELAEVIGDIAEESGSRADIRRVERWMAAEWAEMERCLKPLLTIVRRAGRPFSWAALYADLVHWRSGDRRSGERAEISRRWGQLFWTSSDGRVRNQS